MVKNVLLMNKLLTKILEIKCVKQYILFKVRVSRGYLRIVLWKKFLRKFPENP